MGIKRIVDTDFWRDEKVIDMYSSEDKYFWLYLLTNPQTKQLGVYKLPKRIIAFETGLSLENVIKLIEKFQNTYQTIIYSEETQEIAILNYLKYSIIKGGKPVIDCIEKDIKQVKNTNLLKAVYRKIIDGNDERDTFKKIQEMLSIYNDNDNDNDSIVPRFVPRFVPIEEKPLNSSNKVTKMFDDYSDNADLRQALRDYSIMRNKIKAPLTDRAVTLLLNKLDTLASTEDLKIKLLENATLSNWKSVYPLKEEKQQDKPKQSKPNKFHNFIESDMEEGDLEAMARKRFEKIIQDKKKEDK